VAPKHAADVTRNLRFNLLEQTSMNVGHFPEIHAWNSLTKDGRLLLATRMVRLFAYGMLAVVLVLYFANFGLDEREMGLLISMILFGDVLRTLGVMKIADRIGRARTLRLGAYLMAFSGLVLLAADSFVLMSVGALVGSISPSGNDVGPFMSIEQAALSQTVAVSHRTRVYAWYCVAGSIAAAGGSLCGGILTGLAQRLGFGEMASCRLVAGFYVVFAALLVMLFHQLSSAVEVHAPMRVPSARSTLQTSRKPVLRLAALFMIDSLAGGMVVQSLLGYWLYVRFPANALVRRNWEWYFVGRTRWPRARLSPRRGWPFDLGSSTR
jgi:MFS family permease